MVTVLSCIKIALPPAGKYKMSVHFGSNTSIVYQSSSIWFGVRRNNGQQESIIMLMVITPLAILGFLLIYPLVLLQASLIYLIFWLMTLLHRHMVAMSALILPVFPVMRLYRVVSLIPAIDQDINQEYF